VTRKGYYELPQGCVYAVTRDGVRLAEFRQLLDAYHYIHNKHSFSVAWACAHEGYNIERVYS
jgi:hypothetical protein